MVTIIGHTDLQQLPDAEIRYISDFLSPTLANSFFEDLTNHIPWRQDPITVFGKTHPQPRLTSLHAHTLDSYSYSGIVMTPKPMTDTLQRIEKKSINCVMLPLLPSCSTYIAMAKTAMGGTQTTNLNSAKIQLSLR